MGVKSEHVEYIRGVVKRRGAGAFAESAPWKLESPDKELNERFYTLKVSLERFEKRLKELEDPSNWSWEDEDD